MTASLAAPKDVGARGTMNPERAAKIAAKRIGITADEYMDRRAAGEKWCSGCQSWHDGAAFSRGQKVCKTAAGSRAKRLYAASSPRALRRGCVGRPASVTHAEISALGALTTAEIARRLGVSYWSVRRTLLAGPKKERVRAMKSARWWRVKPEHKLPISLDAARSFEGGEGSEFYDRVITDRVEDPAAVAVRDFASSRLRQIVGDMAPEDVQRMTAWDLDRLRARLADAGLVPNGVQDQERERLRDPRRHSGERVAKAPMIPGKKKRKQKVEHKAANRNRGNSNRPSQKPRKRWERTA